MIKILGWQWLIISPMNGHFQLFLKDGIKGLREEQQFRQGGTFGWDKGIITNGIKGEGAKKVKKGKGEKKK
jgi:hypothetical protein